MISLMQYFLRDEDGAVTVDWVVLAAGIVGLAIVAMTTMENSTLGLATATGTAVSTSTTY